MRGHQHGCISTFVSVALAVDVILTLVRPPSCSAASLDTLSNTFHDELFGQMYPHVTTRLASSNWQDREASILALGAVSEGCHAALLPSLTEIITMLLPMVSAIHILTFQSQRT